MLPSTGSENGHLEGNKGSSESPCQAVDFIFLQESRTTHRLTLRGFKGKCEGHTDPVNKQTSKGGSLGSDTAGFTSQTQTSA